MIRLLLVLFLVLFISLPLFAQSLDTAWVRRYDGPGNGDDDAHAIAVDGSGNVYVTGVSTGDGTGFDYATIKYHSAGDIAWVKRYDGPGNEGDNAHAIAVDGSGHVYVTGSSVGSGTALDYATIKYYSNGDIAWVKRYNGPENGKDWAQAIAVDGSASVYVTGSRKGSRSDYDYDYTTIKYNSNGDIAWVETYNGPENGVHEASAIALDGSGNVYVTGYSEGAGTSYDYATIKYHSAGDIAWVKRYNGPGGNGIDQARAIAVDGSGSVYVTGGSIGSGTSWDYATIKYYSNNLGNLLKDLKKYPEARKELEEAADLFRKQDRKKDAKDAEELLKELGSR